MSAIDTLREAENYFHDQIPLTRAMGLRVVACDQNQFVVEAPVSLNSNHLQTAFGGSINAVATLAGVRPALVGGAGTECTRCCDRKFHSISAADPRNNSCCLFGACSQGMENV